MSIKYSNRGELQTILAQLDQALYNHMQWNNSVIRTLVCRLPINMQDTKANAYRECPFGQWYYYNAPEQLHDYSGYAAIGETHRRLHQLTTNLLLTINAGSPIDINEYDRFANALEKLRLEIFSLKNELEISLYTHDPLTGAINRADMLPVLTEAHEMIKRDTQVCSLVMLDIDDFKKINDQKGHPAADKILVELVHYLTENLRPYDKLFRYGGEEFLLCLQQTETSVCYDRMETLRKGIKDMAFEIDKQNPIHITVSFGIALLDKDSTIEQCIERADKALLAAKASGKDSIKIWTPEM